MRDLTNNMSLYLSFIFVFVLFLSLINFRQTFAEELVSETNETNDNMSSISKSNNYFALNLLKELFDAKENVLISPLSVTTVLNMLYIGAKDRTAEELEDVLGLRALNLTKEQIGVQYRQLLRDLVNSSGKALIGANRLAIQSRNAILKPYEKQLKDYFNSSVQTVDFLFKSEEAVQQINQWIYNTTEGKVEKLLDEPLSPLNVLVLLNAVYFRGQWRERFLKWATKEEDFHGFNKVVKVSHMKLSNQFNYTTVRQLNGSQLIELPYAIYNDANANPNASNASKAMHSVSMYVLLPNSTSADIRSLSDKLTVSLFDEAIGNLSVTTVRLVLPKFKITARYALKNALQALGLRQAFTYKSDLSAIDGTNYLHISDVYHKVICEVDEEGSDGATNTNTNTTSVAATRGLFGRYRNVPTFRADHPFLFFIRHKSSGMILMTGIVNKP